MEPPGEAPAAGPPLVAAPAAQAEQPADGLPADSGAHRVRHRGRRSGKNRPSRKRFYNKLLYGVPEEGGPEGDSEAEQGRRREGGESFRVAFRPGT